MATTVKRHDTWPPLRFAARDENGLLPLEEADSLKLILKSGTTVLLEGDAEAIDPDVYDGFNGQYVWQAGDTNNVGGYQIELEITWDASTTPPRVETVPNSGAEDLNIEVDLA